MNRKKVLKSVKKLYLLFLFFIWKKVKAGKIQYYYPEFTQKGAEIRIQQVGKQACKIILQLS